MKKNSRYLHLALLGIYSIFLIDSFSLYLSGQTIPAVDLPGHVNLCKELLAQLFAGRIFFYDISNFSGWQAFSYYGPLPHLFAAICSMPLSLISDSSIELSVHLTLVLGTALLPWTFFFTTRPVALSLVKDEQAKHKVDVLLTLLILTLSYIFLNIDGELIGIGSSAIFQTGLFSQIFGWHFLLLHFGFLYRFLFSSNRKYLLFSCLSFSLLILSHPLSASFALLFSFFLLILYGKHFRALLIHYALSFLLTSFWLVPYLIYSKDFAINFTQGTNEHFLSYLLHYPPFSLLLAILQTIKGRVPFLNLSHLFIILLLVCCLIKRNLWQSNLWRSLAVSIILVTGLVSGNFIQEALPNGIHFSRYQGYLLIMTIQLLILVPFAFNLASDFVYCNFCLACLICFINTYLLPSEHYLRFVTDPPFQTLESQNKVLNYFKKQEPKGRVFFEYFINPRSFNFITPHYMPSKLLAETGFESLNGLFIQSSLGYHHMATAASLNGIPNYHEDLQLDEFFRPDEETALELLGFFGTTHLVLSTDSVIQRLLPLAESTIKLGQYTILKLKSQPAKINYSSRTLIGYLDLNRTLPFREFELYFFSNKILGPTFDMIELSPDKPIPAELSLILVNSDKEKFAKLPRDFQTSRKLIFDWHGNMQATHYNPAARSRKKNLAELRYFLNNGLKLPKTLLHYREQRIDILHKPATIYFDKQKQELRLNDLDPQKLVRINYSYTPFFSSNDGTIYRGLGERTHFLPRYEIATLKYSAHTHWSYLLGLVLSVLSAILTYRFFFKAS